jgi:hypothetical protein
MSLVTLGASVIGVYIGCRLSAVVNYYVKFLLFTLVSVTAATAFIPLMFFKPFDYRNGL